jgi:hypothetical protein
VASPSRSTTTGSPVACSCGLGELQFFSSCSNWTSHLYSLQNVSFWSCHFWQPSKRLTHFWSDSSTHTLEHCGLYSIHPNHHINTIFLSVKHGLPTKVCNLCPKGVWDISFSMLVYHFEEYSSTTCTSIRKTLYV